MFENEDILSKVEKWVSGAPEIRLRVGKGNPSNSTVEVRTSAKMEPNKRSDIVGIWWNYTEIIYSSWSVDMYSTVATFNWREEDWNGNVDFKVTGKYEQKLGNGTLTIGGGANINNNPGNGIIGLEQDVLFYDATFKQYLTGNGFKWKF